MMLQTLVENAIKHGLEPRPGDGTVWIFARLNDARVAVTVADDGRGFSGEDNGSGIGLKNVRERLQPDLRRGRIAGHRRQFPAGRGCHHHGSREVLR